MRFIKVKAFGHIRSLLGEGEAVLACDEPLPVNAILEQLKSSYPPFSAYLGQRQELLDTLMIGAGSREMQLDSLVQPGEELVLVTPVSGGLI